ncbi:MAG: hypothetical protein GQ564_00330 [Bacteroidales bacterium]|nr:hypothetical protein [Bacteroidales bacterium]
MQFKESQRLRADWDGSDCDHPRILKEYDLGAATTDWVCDTCGKEFSREERDHFNADRDQ